MWVWAEELCVHSCVGGGVGIGSSGGGLLLLLNGGSGSGGGSGTELAPHSTVKQMGRLHRSGTQGILFVKLWPCC